MYCANCGVSIKETDHFCANCGFKQAPKNSDDISDSTKNIGNDTESTSNDAKGIGNNTESINDNTCTYLPTAHIQPGQTIPMGSVTAQFASSIESSRGLEKHYSFSVSALAFWLKENLTVTDELIKGERPNVILGCIPCGTSSISIPIQTLSHVSYHSKVYVSRALVGALFLLWGLGGLLMVLPRFNFVALILLWLGLMLVMNACTVCLQYEKSGIQERIYAPFYCADDLQILKHDIECRIESNNAKLYQANYFLHQMAHSEQVAANQVSALINAMQHQSKAPQSAPVQYAPYKND